MGDNMGTIWKLLQCEQQYRFHETVRSTPWGYLSRNTISITRLVFACCEILGWYLHNLPFGAGVILTEL